MDHQIYRIIDFMAAAFLHIWPYLLITIPVAVVVRLYDGSKYINRIFARRPIYGILVATLIGAISPFCSCGVIPVVASLLIGGVPLAPVMSFWIASPSMDPEMFFLSVSTLGWELAIWRLLATLFLSLGAGLVTHYMVKRGLLENYLQISAHKSGTWSVSGYLRRIWSSLLPRVGLSASPLPLTACASPATETDCGETSACLNALHFDSNAAAVSQPRQVLPLASAADSCSPSECACTPTAESPFWKRLAKETLAATTMVAKFMALAFLIEALIELYIPADWISSLLGRESHYAILWAALIGVPAYTSNLTVLPMVSGLLNQGMNPGAALAFLIAGPTTTLPAMAAVWGLVSRRVFLLYVSIALIGALVVGYLYSAVLAIR